MRDDSNTDGGPAFPSHFNTAVRDGMGGMTLRDYFAAKVLASSVIACSQHELTKSWAEIAEISYAAADAMLKARQQ